MNIEFPEPPSTTVIETGMIRWAIKRALAVHHLSGFCMWAGRAGIGKTTTGRYMAKLIEDAYSPESPRAFRAVYSGVGKNNWSKHEAKRGIRSLYHAVECTLDEGVYRRSLPEELAAELVYFLIKMNIQIILLDEAGCMPLDAIRGLVTVSDKARVMGWTLTIILIGMDNLATKLMRIPQVERRIYEWCYFKPCSLEETHKLLAMLHPYFAGLSLEEASHKEQIRYIHEEYKGIPGNIVLFACLFGSLFKEMPSEDPMVQIRAAIIQPLFDKKLCINDCQNNYSGEMKGSDEDSDTNKKSDE